MSKAVKKVLPVVGAIGGTLLAPGIGTALGSTLGGGSLGAIGGALGGAAGGAASGGGLKGAALGALGGAAFGGAPAIAGASGLGQVGTATLSRGIQGAALGGITGGAKGALTGAGLGAAGGFLTSGGAIPGLGSLGGKLGAGGMGPPTPPSGALGTLGSLTNISGGNPMKLGSLLSAGGDLLGYSQGKDDIEEIQRMLAQQSGAAQAQLQPYSQAGQQALSNLQAPSQEALENDPGYQFRLQQGQQALERSLAARGLGQSGAALKAAQEYGQGLADQTYNDFFNRQSQIAAQGLGAAGGLGSLYTNLGNVQAAAMLEQMNQRNKLYSGLGGLFG